MIENIQAIYKNGVLRPLQPLDLPEDKIVEIDVRDISEMNEKNINKQETVNLAERDISEAEAATQRNAFATFAEDWDSPEMDAYDKL